MAIRELHVYLEYLRINHYTKWDINNTMKEWRIVYCFQLKTDLNLLLKESLKNGWIGE